MSGYENGSARAIASAALRLRSARYEFRRAEARHADARGTPDEPRTMLRVTQAGAEVATREQWLHWIEHGTTIRPAADGEWGLAPETEDSVGALTPGRRAARVEGPLRRTALAMSAPHAHSTHAGELTS